MKKALIGLLLVSGCTDMTVVSEGSRVGVVTKLSHKLPTGCFGSGSWTWEGELSMPSGTRAANQGGEDNAPVGAWAFSIPQGVQTDDLVNQLKIGMDNGHTLRINYNQVTSHDACKSETDYNVVGIRDLSTGTGKQ